MRRKPLVNHCQGLISRKGIFIHFTPVFAPSKKIQDILVPERSTGKLSVMFLSALEIIHDKVHRSALYHIRLYQGCPTRCQRIIEMFSPFQFIGDKFQLQKLKRNQGLISRKKYNSSVSIDPIALYCPAIKACFFIFYVCFFVGGVSC
jgi:hypothetical protein